MKFTAIVSDIKKIKASTLAIFCRQGKFGGDPVLEEVNKFCRGAVKKIYDAGEFEGKLNQTAVICPFVLEAVDKIALVGIGEEKSLNNDCYRQAAGTISRLRPAVKSKSIAFFFDGEVSPAMAQAVVEGFLLGRFEMRDYKTAPDADASLNESVQLVAGKKTACESLRRGMVRGEIIADGVIMARRLAFHPGNVITPETFAAEAQLVARKNRLKISILNERQIRAEKMGALLAVGQGSDKPPRFVILEYRGGRPKAKPIVIVGKGITFDSGGISLKPAQDMDEMKGDMTGGAITLATIATASRLKLPLNLVGLVPLAENMPSGRALKPGDIIRSRKGKTIEVVNTDAEGRLILADALSYADKFKPEAAIDIATLTGAALYVLGYAGAPILGNNRQLMDAIKAASEATAEKVWEMPLWDEYRELMKSSIADLKNSGGRPAGTITAAAFLENFIGDWPWAHIDIAYVDLEKNGRPYIPKGASGIGLRLLIELLSNWKGISDKG
jgi:leucyl aminopeptidase